jgi:hypothetical protein
MAKPKKDEPEADPTPTPEINPETGQPKIPPDPAPTPSPNPSSGGEQPSWLESLKSEVARALQIGQENRKGMEQVRKQVQDSPMGKFHRLGKFPWEE